MIGLNFLLIFAVFWFTVSFFVVRVFSSGDAQLLRSWWSRLLAFLGLLVLPFSYDIGSSIYMNYTFGAFCEGNSGFLKRINDKLTSFKVEPGKYLQLFSEDVEFLEWHIQDDFDKPKSYSPRLHSGYYKVFMRPLGDKDCEILKKSYSDQEIKPSPNQYNVYSAAWEENKNICLAIVMVDGPVAQYQYGQLSYKMKTPYGYEVRATDTFIIDLMKNEKVGLLRGISVSWKLPVTDFILHMSGTFYEGYSRGCGGALSEIRWQDLFQYEEGGE